MRLLITLSITSGQILPLSYQYELSSWLYKCLQQANSSLAEWLHNKGYGTPNHKRFKFFTFSKLQPNGKYKVVGDRMHIFADTLSFEVSFLVPDAAQSMILGLFQSQSFRLGDSISQIDLKIVNLELLPLDIAATTLHLRTKSPIVVSAAQKNDKDRLIHKYLSPHSTDYDYTQYFLNDWQQKYLAATAHGLLPTLNDSPLLHFHCLSTPEQTYSKLIAIKSGREAIKVRGFEFDFEVSAPLPLLQLGLLAGWGEENAMGFGASTIIV